MKVFPTIRVSSLDPIELTESDMSFYEKEWEVMPVWFCNRREAWWLLNKISERYNISFLKYELVNDVPDSSWGGMFFATQLCSDRFLEVNNLSWQYDVVSVAFDKYDNGTCWKGTVIHEAAHSLQAKRDNGLEEEVHGQRFVNCYLEIASIFFPKLEQGLLSRGFRFL